VKSEIKIEWYYQIRDLVDYAERVETKEGNVYYRIPYWFKVDGDNFVMCKDIPEDLGKFITKHRLGGNNPQIQPPKL
jgi:hypothetical protein